MDLLDTVFITKPYYHAHIQDVPKSVIQKSAVITSELEVTIWSGTFQKLRQVFVFSFKPPDVFHSRRGA
jgi:hypothetical protein